MKHLGTILALAAAVLAAVGAVLFYVYKRARTAPPVAFGRARPGVGGGVYYLGPGGVPSVRPVSGGGSALPGTFGQLGGVLGSGVGNAILPGSGFVTGAVGSSVGGAVGSIASGQGSTADYVRVGLPLVGAIPGVADAVGSAADAVGDFVGNIF